MVPDRTDFPAFPYQPYGIQQDFMQALHQTLTSGGVGLFESPTGTGKTLSLICATLQWLDDKHKEDALCTVPSAREDVGDDMPSWLLDQSAEQEQQVRLQHEQDRAARIAKAQTRLVRCKQDHPARKSQQVEPADENRDCNATPDGLEEFGLEEWDSDTGEPGLKRRAARQTTQLSYESSSEEEADNAEVWAEAKKPKRRQVFFCSRTHSQLTQVVGELKRTPFAHSLATVALASRKALCINDDVLRLGSLPRINERCQELRAPKAKKQAVQEKGKVTMRLMRIAAPPEPSPSTGLKKAKAAKACSCPYAASKPGRQKQFVDAILAVPMDVEELARLGRLKLQCPYYGGRAAVPEADLVLVPYSSLLVKETRESLGLSLAGAVVVVDEAHNLVEAVSSAHSATLQLTQVQQAHAQLSGYLERFRTRLAPGNAKHLQNLLAVTALLEPALQQGGSAATAVRTVNDFLFATGLDSFNLFSLIRYTRGSKALMKVSSYGNAHSQQPADASAVGPSSPDSQGSRTAALHAVASFMGCLTNTDADGRIICSPAEGSAKFVLLNAATHFAKVLAEAHAVVLASGTLSPVASLSQQLFPGLAPDRLSHFSCGHVVGKERLLALVVGQGPSGAALDLRFQQQRRPQAMVEVGRLLVNVCTCTPQGVVAFLPSFQYCEALCKHWQGTGIWQALAAKKQVFREPRSATEVEATLQAYSKCIAGGGSAGPGGALMLCVVGGKMAEGINFGNGLGRCVVMVGMPYPNPQDPELRERMMFMDAQHAAAQRRQMSAGDPSPAAAPGQVQASTHLTATQSHQKPAGGLGAAVRPSAVHGAALSTGKQFYEDLCMRAVNQCIGRVIRHSQDWAAVILADCRWERGGPSGPVTKLPGWMQPCLTFSKSFGDAYSRLHRFQQTFKQPLTTK